MANVFIYGGLGVLLLGSIFGVYVAVKGYMATNWSKTKRIIGPSFYHGNVDPKTERLVRIWVITMFIGFILTGIGMAI